MDRHAISWVLLVLLILVTGKALSQSTCTPVSDNGRNLTCLSVSTLTSEKKQLLKRTNTNCFTLVPSDQGYFFTATTGSGVRFPTCTEGGSCACKMLQKCGKRRTDCLKPWRCTSQQGQRLCFSLLSCHKASGSSATVLDFLAPPNAKSFEDFRRGERKSFRRGLVEGLTGCMERCQIGAISPRDSDSWNIQLYGNNISEACIESRNLSIPFRGFNFRLLNATLPVPTNSCSGFINLPLVQATSIFEGRNNRTGGTGASPIKYVGRVAGASGGKKIRLLLQFNISSLPNCGSVASVTLLLNMSKGQDSFLSIHRVTGNWTAGKGGNDDANPTTDAALGEPTWLHRVYNSTLWSAAGGDFIATPSAVNVDSNCDLDGCARSISSAQLAQDVVNWRSGLIPNYGWILVGNEAELQTAQKYNTNSIKLMVGMAG